MATTPSVPTEILARILELSLPSSLAAASLVSWSWNRAAQTLIPTLGLRARLKLHFLRPDRPSNDHTLQRTDASPSWLLGIQSTRFLPDFEREVLSIPSPRAVLMAMAADVIIDCRAFTALGLLEPSVAVWTLSEGIRLSLPRSHLSGPDALNICLSAVMFQVMSSGPENDDALLDEVLQANNAALHKALDLCRLLRVPHIQFDRLSYLSWSKSTPPFRGIDLLPAVTEVSFVSCKDQQLDVASIWGDGEISLAISLFTLEVFPFPNTKRLLSPYGELHITPCKNLRFLRLNRTTATKILNLLHPWPRKNTTTFVSDHIDMAQFPVDVLPPKLEEFGTISLELGMTWTPDQPYIGLLSALPTSVHTLHAKMHLADLHHATTVPLLDLFTQFSTMLPPGTRRLILTITGAGPRQENMRPTGRKLLCALVEIAKRVVVEVRLERGAGDRLEEVELHASWKKQLNELVAAEVLKSGSVILDRPKRDYDFA
ncbi:hypothetical protein M427DRAFT_60661 [Gonapodya prolifera JEL478]|uniref:F-box domain-containing protein n=1 Tax=Gonapodya prolifera (strain JEL478) TaxID=1344416 RepID=A0A139A4U6_GONPJ|nr:hypothetical protein M427DRAFT_60661 [Gonapodya prolifera JEL478]|eukprot:KXS11413.1 hypothetical protein M427DRAFT_60661 [Gonapodya prolifera JEL478]